MARSKISRILSEYPSIFWTNSVDENRLKSVKDDIDKLIKEKNPRKVVLCIANLGGDLNAALAFYNWVKPLNLHLITVATGAVGSAAVMVFLAGKQRFASRHSWFLMHDPENTINEPITIRTKEGILRQVDLTHAVYLEIFSEATGASKERIDEVLQKALTLSPEEAKELGLVHEIY